MFIDSEKMKREVSAWLKTEAGKKLLEDMAGSFVVDLIFTVASFLIGLFLTATIVGARTGLALIWNAITLQEFGTSGPKRETLPDLLTPIVLHPIISGPQGHSAALGTFDPRVTQDADRMATMAQYLGHLYTSDEVSADEQDLQKLMRQDRFVRNRRRLVPEPLAKGAEIWIFDILLEHSDCALRRQNQALCAAVATEGPTGSIRQIPWSVVADAVTTT